MSSALDFASGKLWVAQQLDSIAHRYLNRTASTVARQVRQALLTNNTNLNLFEREQPMISHQSKLMPFPQRWSGAMESNEVYQSFITEDTTVSPVPGTSNDSGSGEDEKDTFADDARSWNP